MCTAGFSSALLFFGEPALLYETPSHYFLCSGSSEGYTELNAFDQALLDAGIGDTNLVRMSSILPPGCQRVEPFGPPAGALVPVAYSAMRSSTPGDVISAAVAIAVADDPSLPGLIMEYHGAEPLNDAVEQVREMARRGMQYRERGIDEVLSTGVEHEVESPGAVFAGVVLWNGDRP